MIQDSRVSFDYEEEFASKFIMGRRPTKKCTLPLDPIDGGLAGCITVAIALSLLLTMPWAVSARLLMAGERNPNEAGWAGYNGRPTSIMTSDGETLAALASMQVLEELRGIGKKTRAYCKVVRVPKGNGRVSRAVANCRAVNNLCGKPEGVELVGPQDVADTLGLFEDPWFVTLDLRHYYYQIELHASLRHLFTVRSRERAYQFGVWPMGFKFTPYVGQAISASYAYRAAKSAGFDIAEEFDESAVPPWWTLRLRSGEVAGRVFTYADNIVGVMHSEHSARALSAALDKIARHYRIRVKEPGIVVSHEAMEFNGVVWSKQGQQICWQHKQDNCAKWSKLSVTPRMKAEDVAGLLGVIYWDWYVSGEVLGKIAEVVETSRWLAKTVKQEWSQLVNLSQSVSDMLQKRIAHIITTHENRIVRKRVPWYPNNIWLASDACLTGLAGVLLEASGANQLLFFEKGDWTNKKNVTEEEEVDHINKLECRAALQTIKNTLDRGGSQSTLVVGCDNTTAVKALRLGFFPADEELSAEIWNVHMRIQQQDCAMVVVHIPGEMQPADEPSRGKEVCRAKVSRAVAWLKVRMTMNPDHHVGGRKRIREE